MLRKFIKIFTLFFVAQVAVQFDWTAWDVLATLIIFVILFSVYKIIPEFGLESITSSFEIKMFYLLVLALSVYVINWLKLNYGISGMLNAHENVGMVHKIGGVFLPGLVAYGRLNRLRGIRAIEVIVLVLVILLSITTLSKHYLVSLIWVYVLTIKSINFTTISSGLLIAVVLGYTYILRGENDLNVVSLTLLNRLPIYYETKECLKYVFDNGLFDWVSPWQLSANITEEVFERNPRYMGWAPGLIGVFILYYGLFSVLIVPLFFMFLNNLFRALIRVKYMGLVTVVIFFDCLHSLIDGLPHILTSVNKGKVFYGYVILSALIIVQNAIFSKKNISHS